MSADEYKFKVLTFAELKPHLDESNEDHYEWLDDVEWSERSGEARFASVIALFGPDGFMKVIASDGGEPEDNSFRRDGAWIAPYLNQVLQGEL